MSDDDESNYTPIDCGVYSEYELAIMHQRKLRLHWHDDDGNDHIESVLPLDLRTRNKCEYLVGRRHGGGTITLRLDRIVRAAVADRMEDE